MVRGRDSEAHGPTWQVQAALIARRFYLEGRSKVEIADELGLSRFKVARILDDARELGLVEVRVNLPAPIDPDLSSALQERLGLRHAVVVQQPPQDSSRSTREELGRMAAELISELVTVDDVLGLTCSRTVAATTQALQTLAACPVVQLCGTLAGPDMEAGSVESVRRASDVGGGQAFPIYAPMVLPDAATVRALAGESAIKQTVRLFPDVTVAVVAVGAWRSELSTVWETVGALGRSQAGKAGAVGEIGARLFDAHGKAVRTSIDDRVLGVTLDQLHAIPEVIGLAYDERRAPAVSAAVQGGLVNSLVCDTALGERLLETAPERRPGRPGDRGATA
ncbi:MAG TPA: sugar-binding domain-containing protein [Nocardioidaceae bacterium]|nr:sugar-binding domain-containing protein [Nocardioidaceae bacterium]